MPTAALSSMVILFTFLLSPHLAAPMDPAAAADPDAAAHDLLGQFGLPRGLLPGNVVSYTKSDDGRFTVELSGPCYSQFSVLAYYGKTVEGKVAYGALSDLSGIQVRKYFVWFPVSRVLAGDGDGTILFDAGGISERHPASEFQDVHPCNTAVAAGADQTVTNLKDTTF